MSYSTPTLGLPIILLGTLWGAVNTTLSFFNTINERRDMVFSMIDTCGSCTQQTLGPLHIYFTNVLPLTTGLNIFLFLVCYVVISIPHYMKIDDEKEVKLMVRACKYIAVLPAFGFLGFLGGGIFDAIMISRAFA